MYALMDCNNFYCSCERLFNPKLNNRPIVVLSNNDGCIISRSDEAKQLNIAMGTPAFLVREFLEQQQVALFSSNYALYGDMSDRVVKTAATFASSIEIYSIDEAFLDLTGTKYINLHDTAFHIRQTVIRNTGIPVSVGVAPTKTLAKMANAYAKKHRKAKGVHCADTDDAIEHLLKATDVSDIWGIGHQYALLLRRNGFQNAFAFSTAPDDWVRDKMHVTGVRLLNELRGIACIEWQSAPSPKKNICMSRAFGRTLTEKADVMEAVANYAACCAIKLREQKTVCRSMQVFIHTHPHKTDEQQYQRSVNLEFDRPTNHSAEIIKLAGKGLDIIFQTGYRFMKAGVMVMDIISEEEVQASLFDNANIERDKKMMAVMDSVNKQLGKETVKMAVQGVTKGYKMRRDHLSPCYTTNINELLKVNH